LERFLDRIQLDPGFVPLVRLLSRLNIPHAIVSDGVDHFIQRTLERHGVSVPVRSNTIDRDGPALALRCPLQRSDCRSAAAHCKCGSMEELARACRSSIYIGDGRSDLCPARTADYVFAKGALAAALEKEGREFVRFGGLGDVVDTLEREWKLRLSHR
jgi:2,3-diketo-5-methylthio-1-phosphopentane phosphatase